MENGNNEEIVVVEKEPQQPKQAVQAKFGNPIVLLTIITAFALMLLNFVISTLLLDFRAIQITNAIFGILAFACIAIAFTLIILNYRKTGKTVINLELILALLALLVFFV